MEKIKRLFLLISVVTLMSLNIGYSKEKNNKQVTETQSEVNVYYQNLYMEQQRRDKLVNAFYYAIKYKKDIIFYSSRTRFTPKNKIVIVHGADTNIKSLVGVEADIRKISLKSIPNEDHNKIKNLILSKHPDFEDSKFTFS